MIFSNSKTIDSIKTNFQSSFPSIIQQIIQSVNLNFRQKNQKQIQNQIQTNFLFFNLPCNSFCNRIGQILPNSFQISFKLLGFFLFLFCFFSLSNQTEIKTFAENKSEIIFENLQINNENQTEKSNLVQNVQEENTNLQIDKKNEKSEKYKSEIQEMLDLINKERVKNGAGILKPQKNLVKTSRYFADYLATSDLDGSFFDHQEKSGRGPWERCRDFEYPITCGENLAAGQLEVKNAFEDLMKSSSHRKNILNPKYCQIGISKSENPKSYYGIYWVQNFGRNCE